MSSPSFLLSFFWGDSILDPLHGADHPPGYISTSVCFLDLCLILFMNEVLQEQLTAHRKTGYCLRHSRYSTSVNVSKVYMVYR